MHLNKLHTTLKMCFVTFKSCNLLSWGFIRLLSVLPCFCGCSRAPGYLKPLIWCAVTCIFNNDSRGLSFCFLHVQGQIQQGRKGYQISCIVYCYEYLWISRNFIENFKSMEQLQLTNKDRILRTMSYVLSSPSFRSASTFEIWLVHGILTGRGLSISIGLNGDEVKLNRKLFGIKIS